MTASSTTDELRARLHQQEVVAELGRQALETDDVDRLVDDAVTAVADTVGGEFCAVFEMRPGGDRLRLRRGVGWRDGLVGEATVPADRTSQEGSALRSTDPVLVEDLHADERVAGSALHHDHDVRSGISATVGSVDDPWGVLGVYATERRAFDERDATFVEGVANVLASAVRNRRVERRLEEQRRLNDQIADTSPVGITVVDADGEIRFANERAEEILGRTRAEIESRSHDDPDWDLVDADGDPLARETTPFEQVVSTGEPVFDEEVGLLLPDGDRVWLSVNGAPLDADVDADSTAVFAFTDVTEQRRLETEFEEMVGRITDAFYAVDEQFRFTHVNERAAELLQRPQDELVGEPLWEMFPEAAEVDEVWEAFQRALNEQEPTSYEVYFPPLGIWVEANLYPSDTGVSVYFRDITDQKEYERELERYRALTEAANDVIVTIDAESTIRSINPAVEDVFGYEPDDLLGESLTTLMRDDLATRHLEALARYLETDERTLEWNFVEIPGQRADGSEVPLAITFSEVTYESGRYFTGIVRDATEREERERQVEQMNERLKQSNERLEQFAYAASHDLQEPLRMVSSYLRLIENRYADDLDESGREFLAFAVDGADRMREMIDSLLTYSRVDTRGDPFEAVDLEAVLADVREDLQVRLAEHDAEVTADPLPRVQADPSQIRQVFQNLLDNAVEYSGDAPPRVRVSAERDGDRWTISVADDGVGFDPADADRVFEVFQSLHPPSEHSGTGIGLALCERIVERHGGDIWVEPTPGEGATFSFTLPAAGGDRA